MERKQGRKENTVSLFPLCFKFMWVCTYIVCGCVLLCRFWRWRSGVVVYHSRPFLWSRVFLCTWRLPAAYLSWNYRDVQDSGLVMWVLGRELWSSWFHSKLSSPSYWCFLKMWVWGRDIHIYVCMQVCLPMRVLRGQRSTPLSSFVAFLLYFLRWDLTETWAPRFQRGWLALSSLGLSQRRGSMWLLACSALAGHWDPNSAPRVSIANTSLTEPPWSSWF